MKHFDLSVSGVYHIVAKSDNMVSANSNSVEVNMTTITSHSVKYSYGVKGVDEAIVALNLSGAGTDTGSVNLRFEDDLTAKAGFSLLLFGGVADNQVRMADFSSSDPKTRNCVVYNNTVGLENGIVIEDLFPLIKVPLDVSYDSVNNRYKVTTTSHAIPRGTYELKDSDGITIISKSVELDTMNATEFYLEVPEGYGYNGKANMLYCTNLYMGNEFGGYFSTTFIDPTPWGSVDAGPLKTPVITYNKEKSRLEWEDVGGATSYEVYRNGTKIGEVSASTGEYTPVSKV